MDGAGTGNRNGLRDKSGARDLLMVSLSRFYSTGNNMGRVLPYLTGKSGVSLRLVDWFVTNFSKKHNVVISRPSPGSVGGGGGINFNVYLSYRAQLKAYSKQQFDPFRRRDRIMFFYDRTTSVETTVGQLNFFRWMLVNNVIDYLVERAEEIEKDMVAASSSASSSRSPSRSSADEEDEVDEEETPAPAPVQSVREAPVREKAMATVNMTRTVGSTRLVFD